MVKHLVRDDFIAGHTKPARHNHTRHGGLSDANIQHKLINKKLISTKTMSQSLTSFCATTVIELFLME